MLSEKEIKKVCKAPYEVTSTIEDQIFGIQKGTLYKGNSLETAKNVFREEWLKILDVDIDDASQVENPLTEEDHLALWCKPKRSGGRIITTIVYPMTDNPDRVFSIF